MAKVQPFREHLRADKHLRLAGFEIADNLFVSRACAGRIEVQPRHSRIGEKACHLLLDLFRPEAHDFQLLPVAFGAMAGIRGNGGEVRRGNRSNDRPVRPETCGK